jgi:hypothetical protein
MQIRYPSLGETDYAELINYLDHGLKVFDRIQGQLSPAELQVKGMLTALRKDLARSRSAQGHPDLSR